MVFDKKLAIAFLLKLEKLIPRFAPNFSDSELLSLWSQQFKDWTEEDFSEVFRRSVDTNEQFPSIAELKDHKYSINFNKKLRLEMKKTEKKRRMLDCARIEMLGEQEIPPEEAQDGLQIDDIPF